MKKIKWALYTLCIASLTTINIFVISNYLYEKRQKVIEKFKGGKLVFGQSLEKNKK